MPHSESSEVVRLVSGVPCFGILSICFLEGFIEELQLLDKWPSLVDLSTHVRHICFLVTRN